MAAPAHPTAYIAAVVGVGLVERMPVDAMRLESVLGGRADTTEGIDPMRYGFEMVGSNAGRHSA